jgi:undecaprenyl-diphosphatase
VNAYALAALLGIIEGITEFLPISSTAHLRIAQALLGIDLGDPYWKAFSIVIQLGAILCLPFYFRHRIRQFVTTFPRGSRGDRTLLTHPLALTFIAFVTTAGPAYLLAKVIGKNLESLSIMGWALIVGGLVMGAVDLRHGRRRERPGDRTSDLESMTIGQAIWIGACQTLAAVFPGTSRSMATITAGELAGMTRAAALEFSFFLSMPTMAAATLFDLWRSLRPVPGVPIGAIAATAHDWAVLLVGFAVSFVVAYAVVAWFMRWVRTHGFIPFALYRIAAGLLVLGSLAR